MNQCSTKPDGSSISGFPFIRYLTYVYLPVFIIWAIAMTIVGGSKWGLFLDSNVNFMSFVMAAGSFIAGSTSMGGGAVAFPVMTLGYEIPPMVARDFSLMVQSVGMMAATAAILMMRFRLERKALLWSGLGGLVGLYLGYEVLSPLLSPNVVKTLFASMVFSFGLMLWWMNRHTTRFRVTAIRRFDSVVRLELILAGLVGGIISGVLGNGIDIVVFSVLVLRFGICEKVATPTSVILMGTNALAGMLWGGATGSFSVETWNYWWVCVPVVAFGAPFGAWCMSYWHRLHIVWFICALIVIQYISTLIIIPQTTVLVVWNVLVVGLSLLLFRLFHQAYKAHRTGFGGVRRRAGG
uniref:Probable membrane transporter protein n=1 Tax=Candidatus Kentrum sp. FW TaxID=2126338 RepID=A0A450TBR9_9GAMM|nr:MAG: Uncharacterized membrane protein YfcA [Candidatus Kentron sp. FW]VFJ70880.1 MAG: Uncharacterized membrane protein YfcA [Candidatus Kentron sp. FW]